MIRIVVLAGKCVPLKFNTLSNVRVRTFSSNCVKKKPINRCKKPVWWRRCTQLLEKYMLITNTLICGCLMSLGDLIQQDLRLYMQGKPLHNFDWDRNKKMMLIGFMQGPVMHVFYGSIDRYIHGVNLKSVSKKVLVDQLIGSPMFISTFFLAAGYLNHEKFEDILQELKEKFLTVYTVC